jgi:hypothetical protein
MLLRRKWKAEGKKGTGGDGRGGLEIPLSEATIE